MPLILNAMKALAATISTVTDRPVTIDPRSTTVTPCVLVELPELDFQAEASTMCGQTTARINVLVIGTGSGLDALPALDALLSEVLDSGLAVTGAVPVAYQPVNNAMTADPVLAYRVTVEEWL